MNDKKTYFVRPGTAKRSSKPFAELLVSLSASKRHVNLKFKSSNKYTCTMYSLCTEVNSRINA